MVLRVRLVEEIPVRFLVFFVSQAVPLEYCILKSPYYMELGGL